MEPCPSITLGGQYLVFTSVAELESAAIIEALRPKLKTHIYSIGTAIPNYFPIQGDGDEISCPDYLTWLDAQPANSVLYISQGSFLSLSAGQLEEIVAGVCESGVRFFWVARENMERLRESSGGGEQGLIVSWCDQLRVLRHRSVGGFWSHCGLNSTKEGAFAGVPFLAFPIALDQFTNCKQIVEDWKIGWKVKKGCDNDGHMVGETSNIYTTHPAQSPTHLKSFKKPQEGRKQKTMNRYAKTKADSNSKSKSRSLEWSADPKSFSNTTHHSQSP